MLYTCINSTYIIKNSRISFDLENILLLGDLLAYRGIIRVSIKIEIPNNNKIFNIIINNFYTIAMYIIRLL